MSARARAIRALGAAISIVFASVASAQDPTGVTDLACTQPALHYRLFLSVDFRARTAATWFKPATLMDVRQVPATITESLVAWTLQAPPGISSFTLDRDSGTLTVLHPNRETERWTCEKDAQASVRSDRELRTYPL
jgi:hypothetical protein